VVLPEFSGVDRSIFPGSYRSTSLSSSFLLTPFGLSLIMADYENDNGRYAGKSFYLMIYK
jgi:hypothetical protein